MEASAAHVVTGAYGYSGRHIAGKLLERGLTVRTLTNSPDKPNPFGERVKAAPLSFEDPEALIEALCGAAALYNTYWVRFNARTFNHEQAVRNSEILFECARRAGVERIVHVSITNPSPTATLSYFRGKAQVEAALKASGISHAILRPAVLFGGEDILINNIAWMLRRAPVFGIFGDGEYRLQPIHVDDLAELAAEQGARRENVEIEAIGPETFTYRELVATLAEALGKRRRMVSIPPALGYAAGKMMGWLTGDVVITRDEIEGLMAGLLSVEAPPAGRTRLSEWARAHAETLGRRYANELARRK